MILRYYHLPPSIVVFKLRNWNINDVTVSDKQLIILNLLIEIGEFSGHFDINEQKNKIKNRTNSFLGVVKQLCRRF